MEKPRTKNAPISIPLLYQWRVKRRNGHTPRAQLKETLHQEPRVKSEGLFWEKLPFSGKCLSFWRISGHFRTKKLCVRVHTCLLTSTSEAKN